MLKIFEVFKIRHFFSSIYTDISNYKLEFLKRDLLSAFSIALLSIPQSIAYSLLAQLPPMSGIFSSIFGTIFTGALSSSKHLIASPTTGVSILIQTAIAEILFAFYPDATMAQKEVLSLNILSLLVFMIGMIQIVASLLNFSKLLQFVSRTVILGYLFGIALAIFISQLFYVLGIGKYFKGDAFFSRALHLVTHLKEINFTALFIALVCGSIMIFLKKKFPKSPAAFIALGVSSLFAFFLNLYFQNFSSFFLKHVNNLEDVGLASFSKISFFIPPMNFEIIQRVFFSALPIALLAMLEIFSVTRFLSAKSGHESSINRDLVSTGISNLFLSFLKWSMPISASFSRSILNVENRAKTRLSSIFSGLFVAFFIYILWPFVKQVPLAALAAILITIVFALQDWEQIKLLFRATAGDAIVFLLTVASCLFFRLDVAFYVGIGLSIVSFLQKAASFHLVEYAFDPRGRLALVPMQKAPQREVRIIGIGGEMFFAGVDLFQSTMKAIAKDPYVKAIVLRFQGVYHVDASMCIAMLGLHEYLKATHRHLLISGIGEEVLKIFKRANLIEKIGQENLFITDEGRPQLSTWKACERATLLIEDAEIKI